MDGDTDRVGVTEGVIEMVLVADVVERSFTAPEILVTTV